MATIREKRLKETLRCAHWALKESRRFYGDAASYFRQRIRDLERALLYEEQAVVVNKINPCLDGEEAYHQYRKFLRFYNYEVQLDNERRILTGDIYGEESEDVIEAMVQLANAYGWLVLARHCQELPEMSP